MDSDTASVHSAGAPQIAGRSGVEETPSVSGDLATLPRGMYLCEARHNVAEVESSGGPAENGVVSKWRMNNRDRMRTGSVALVLCLNIGVDPPDVIKLPPSARLECWLDPMVAPPQDSLKLIGDQLQEQYQRWQPRAHYKIELDPTTDEIRRLCTTSRRNAKHERVLFHYNGHGVPKPTTNGEIWLFNKDYTQYMPLSVYELDTWLGTPSIYVFDCSAAGLIVSAFCGGDQRQEWGHGAPPLPAMKDCILLAACGVDEVLPQSADLPADAFTSCLTTPIKVALKWFCPRSLLKDILHPDMIDKIPGRQPDRKTLLGELNWIFTAITDTIAWNVLPRELFQRLFRQDLLVASLFRNFLLAERIMRSSNCTPQSYPSLPPTHQHHMWLAWDLAAEMCLAQLPGLLQDPKAKYQPSPFFEDQLTAFEVWLRYGSERKRPPEQLPIVLQVLLSQPHRYRALVLLGKFLDMGAWAVELALSVGIFPYVLKLLQTSALELRPVLVFIWTKILTLDKSCQVDLLKDKGHLYFIKSLQSPDALADEKAMAAFVLTVIADSNPKGQKECIAAQVPEICVGILQDHSSEDDPLLPQWLCLCLAKLWDGATDTQKPDLQDGVNAVARMLTEPQPEVRAAATYALGILISVNLKEQTIAENDDPEWRTDMERDIVASILPVSADGSPLVRTELCIALARLAYSHNAPMRKAAASYLKPPPQQRRWPGNAGAEVRAAVVAAGAVPDLESQLRAMGPPGEASSVGRPIPYNFSPLASMIPLLGYSAGPGSAGRLSRVSSLDSHRNAVAAAILETVGSAPEVGRVPVAASSKGSSPNAFSVGATSPVSPSGFPKVGGSPTLSERDLERGAMFGPGIARLERDESMSSIWPSPDNGSRDYIQVVKTLCVLTRDPYPHVAELAKNILLQHCGIDQAQLRAAAAQKLVATQPYVQPAIPSPRTSPVRTAPLSSSLGTAALLASSSMPGLTRSSSWVTSGNMAPWMKASPPRPAFLTPTAATTSTGMRRVVSSADFVSPSFAAAFQEATRGTMLTRAGSLNVEMIASTPPSLTLLSAHSRSLDADARPAETPAASATSGAPGSNSGGGGPSQVHNPYLPNSTFYGWSCSYLAKPAHERDWQMDDDLLELREEREKLVFDGIAKCQHLGVSKVSDQISQWDTESSLGTKALLLHPFIPTVCISDEKGTIRVWNYEEDQPLVNMFESQKVPERTGVSRMCLLNELGDSLLLVASLDGGMCVWRNFMEKDQQRLVTAWQAVQTPTRRSGCAVDWQQHKGHLYVSGEVSCVMVWDLHRESLAIRVPTKTESIISSLSASQVHAGQMVAGFMDGSIRIFDMRTRGIVRYTADPATGGGSKEGHVVGVDFQPGGDGVKLVAASANGELQFLDMRAGPSNAVYHRVEAHADSLTSLAVHRHAPVIATGTSKQSINVYNLRGEQLSVIRYHNSFLGQRIGPVSCLQFHPYGVLLAAGATDSIVSMYAGETR